MPPPSLAPPPPQQPQRQDPSPRLPMASLPAAPSYPQQHHHRHLQHPAPTVQLPAPSAAASLPPRRPPPSPWSAQRLWSGLSKRSLHSFRTSSFEADDEHSSDSDSMSSSSGPSDFDDGDRCRRRHARVLGPRYAGQDLRSTSTKELLGWYSYAFAAETYPVCGIGSFIPILLETLARENGVLLHDRSKPCGSSDVKGEGDGQCVVNILGMDINTASFAMYTFSFSVLVQALLVVSISGAADHGTHRKTLLLAFGWAGAFSVMAFIFVSKPTYLLGAVLAIVSNTSFGASFVLLNSFLPLLVRHHPDVVESNFARTPDPFVSVRPASRESQDSFLASSTSPLLAERGAADAADAASADATTTTTTTTTTTNGTAAPAEATAATTTRKPALDEPTSIELQMSTQISTKGVGIGYSAALFVQCLAIGIVVMGHNSTLSQRVALLAIGSWWAVFTIPPALFLRPRPGPPLPAAASGRGRPFAWVTYSLHAWGSLFRTMRLARRLLDICLFLGGWFLLSDAVATTSSTAILFAKNELHMKPWSLGMINVLSTAAGIVGAFSWSPISRGLGLLPHQTLLACIALFEIIPLYGLLGYLPFVQGWGVFGLQQPWEMYPLALVYGFVLGGLSAYARSVYGELIPPGSEAAFYALYAITDKGSSVFGPAIVGAIIGRFGGIRPAFWFLLLVVGLPAPLIYFVDVSRGKREGHRVSRAAGGFRASGLLSVSDGDDEAEDRGILAAFGDEQARREAADGDEA